MHGMLSLLQVNRLETDDSVTERLSVRSVFLTGSSRQQTSLSLRERGRNLDSQKQSGVCAQTKCCHFDPSAPGSDLGFLERPNNDV